MSQNESKYKEYLSNLMYLQSISDQDKITIDTSDDMHKRAIDEGFLMIEKKPGRKPKVVKGHFNSRLYMGLSAYEEEKKAEKQIEECRNTCSQCRYWDCGDKIINEPDEVKAMFSSNCKLNPVPVEKYGSDWCGQFNKG